MKRVTVSLVAAGLLACASAPRGPSDAEVRELLDGSFRAAVQAVQTGSIDAFVAHFAQESTMVLRGVGGPDGNVLNVDLAGPAQIRPFMVQVGAPPNFDMRISSFRREGAEATQTGQWTIADEQAGTFTLTWRQNEQGDWRIVIWRFDAG